MAGGPDNPLGARALYLGATLYRIHGSNEPWTIGHAVSSGCIRMRNEDVIDLYDRGQGRDAGHRYVGRTQGSGGSTRRTARGARGDAAGALSIFTQLYRSDGCLTARQLSYPEGRQAGFPGREQKRRCGDDPCAAERSGIALAAVCGVVAARHPAEAGFFRDLIATIQTDGEFSGRFYPEQVPQDPDRAVPLSAANVELPDEREARHDHHRSAGEVPLLRARRRTGDPLWRRRRPRGLRLERHRAVGRKQEWPTWTRRRK